MPTLELWEAKVKIECSENLLVHLDLVSNDITLQSHIMVSIEENSPIKAPCDDETSTKQLGISALSTHSSRGSDQGNFHQKVLTCVLWDYNIITTESCTYF
jgi:hypothetical protein